MHPAQYVHFDRECDLSVNLDGNVPEDLLDSTLNFQTPIHNEHDQLHVLDAPTMLHRWQFIRHKNKHDSKHVSMLRVQTRRSAPFLNDTWDVWQGPPATTGKCLQYFRSAVPKATTAHALADSIRMLSGRVAEMVSFGRHPAVDYPDPLSSHVGPWLSPVMSLGAYHGRAGRLLSIQEGGEWVKNIPRHFGGFDQHPHYMFKWSDVNEAFRGVLASPHIVVSPQTVKTEGSSPSSSTYVLLKNYEKDEETRCWLTRFRILCLDPNDEDESHERGCVVAQFAGRAALPLAWTVMDDDSTAVIIGHPWIQTRPWNEPQGNIRGNLWANLEWHPSQDTIFYVVDLKGTGHGAGGLTAMYRSQAAFFTNILGAKRTPDDDSITLDCNTWDGPEGYQQLVRGEEHPEDYGHVRRYTLRNVSREQAAFVGAAGSLPSHPLAPFDVLWPESAVMTSDPCKPILNAGFTSYCGMYRCSSSGDGVKKGKFSLGWWNAVDRLSVDGIMTKCDLGGDGIPAMPPVSLSNNLALGTIISEQGSNVLMGWDLQGKVLFSSTLPFKLPATLANAILHKTPSKTEPPKETTAIKKTKETKKNVIGEVPLPPTDNPFH